MPTFKLEDDEIESPKLNYHGDNDIFFRQWRQQSMKPIFEQKKNREFFEAEQNEEEKRRCLQERRRKHHEKFDKKMEALRLEFEQKAEVSTKPTGPVLRNPTVEEKENLKKSWQLEYESPSSTAKMTQARQLPQRPRNVPLFGSSVGGLIKTAVAPKVSQLKNLDFLKNTPVASLQTPPTESSFLNNSQESVFFPQANSSFNLDSYNGNRPSFAFARLQGATSTPVSKTAPKFSVGSQIAEESYVEESKYITARESPGGNSSIFGIVKDKEEERIRLENEKIEELKREKIRIKEERDRIEKLRKDEEEKRNIEIKKKQEEERIRKIKEENERLRKEKGKNMKNEENEGEEEEEASKIFEQVIALLPAILKKKEDYEKSAPLEERATLKRTINERITTFTKKETDQKLKTEITNYFRALLSKKTVEGYGGVNKTVELKLSKDDEIFYTIYCIVDKYLTIIALDDDLINSVSHFISWLSASHKKLEIVFMSLILNRSIVLRQKRRECIKTFVETRTDTEYAILLTKEKALVSLFLNVFAKNVILANSGRSMKLNEETLWKYAERVLDGAGEVPKAALIIESLVTICKSGLSKDTKRWVDFMDKLKNEVLPEMEDETHFKCDESVVKRLKWVLTTNGLL